jgi:YidC/Oxa1 family membrane protein insertase
MLDFDLNIDGVSKMLTNNRIGFNWQNESPAIEKDKEYELTQTHICHSAEQKFDFDYIGEGGDKEIKNANWLCIKQQFFISALISKNKFSEVKYDWKIPTDTTEKYLTRVNTNASYTFANQENLNIPLQLYFGPSDYNILKQYKNDLEYVVPYGSGIFSFVKYINRYFLLPVFDFIQKHVMNMGMVILLITLLIRLITSPILYKSYLSGAKMKVLKPEVDALKEKYKDDQQTFGMEQMKLWKSAGVSPLGGCLPALLQIPIFMSLYYFFQSNIDLRGKGFLWANDLAQYDSIATLPFSIPFYGDHVSLFTITAVITSLLISIYSMSNMQDNSNPLMKYMPYIFPVMLLGVFNKLPSALTWYYTISNTITLLLQIVIQKYIIDHDKIMLEIAENRKKPVKKSKMQERIESMQETQKKIQDMKQKSTKK